MEPNTFAQNETTVPARPPPDYPSPSTSGLGNVNAQEQNLMSENLSNETQNNTESQLSLNSEPGKKIINCLHYLLSHYSLHCRKCGTKCTLFSHKVSKSTNTK